MLRFAKTLALPLVLLNLTLAPIVASSEELPLLTIKEMYIGEDQGKSIAAPDKIIRYLRTPEEKAAHKLTIENGVFYGPGHRPFDSSSGKFTYAEGEGVDLWSKAIIVLDEKDDLYFSLDKVEYQFHHSSLNAGKPVKFAGDMYVKDGKLIKFTNNSGHYKPSVKHVHQFMRYLESKGVDITQVQFDLNQGSFKAFFDAKPSATEIQHIADYTLEEALRYISKHPDEEWFDLYKQRIQEALKKNPKGLKHLLNTLDTQLSPKAAEALIPALQLHADQLFDSKEILHTLNNHFDSKAVDQILAQRTKAAIEKAKTSGLQSLNNVEIQTIGLTQRNKTNWVDDAMLNLLQENGYGNRVTREMLPDLYTNMRLWNLEKFDQFLDKTSPAPVNVPQGKSCNLMGLIKNIFKK